MIRFELIPPMDRFVGRVKEIKELEHLYKDPITKCVVISGLGGQGKTQLVRKFVTKLGYTKCMTWLNGKTLKELACSFQNLAKFLQLTVSINGKEQPLKLQLLILQIANKIKYLDNTSWLLVIDNVVDQYPKLQEILNIITNLAELDVFVVIISRRNDIFLKSSIHQITLEPLERSHAHILIKTFVKGLPHEKKQLLCETTGSHPLALTQALGYILLQRNKGIQESSYDVTDYLQDLKENPKKLLQHPLKYFNYNATIYQIVSTELKSIRKNSNWIEKIGIILSLVHSDGITLTGLHKIMEIFCMNRDDEEKTKNAVQLLVKFCLVSRIENEIVIMHSLIQTIFRQESNWQDNIQLFLDNVEISDLNKDEIQHVKNIWGHASSFPEILKQFPQFPNQLFKRMKKLTKIPDLQEFAEKNGKVLRQIMGTDHVETLNMEFNLADALEQNGKVEEALSKFRQVFEKMNRVLGPNDSATIITSTAIENVLWRMKRCVEALDWNYQVLTSRGIVLPQYYHGQILKWRVKGLGPKHPETLMFRHNIATFLYESGHWVEAKAKFETILVLKIEVCGEEHENTIDTKAWLAHTCWKMGEKKKALEMLEEVLAFQEKVLGIDHLDTIRSRDTIAEWNKSK